MSTLVLPPSHPTLLRGYEAAQRVARYHAKSFFLCSFLLRGERRQAAYALYAFCRRLDDLVDEQPLLPGGSGKVFAQLDAAKAWLQALYAGAPLPPWPDPRAPSEELCAFADTVRRFSIPLQPFLDLVLGMQMDLTRSRYATFGELDVYCYRVAGTVGRMMASVLGYRDEAALEPAADLGRAMQLTNILRDVREDLDRGRIYLPLEELEAHHVDEAQLRAGRMKPNIEALFRFQLARARTYYARAAVGIPYLHGGAAQRMVRVMSAVYGGILDVIESRRCDVFASRAFVPLPRKLLFAAKVLLSPSPSLTPLPVRVAS